MTFTISQPLFYYWIFAIIFEAIYCFYLWKQAKKKIAKNAVVMLFINTMKTIPSLQLILNKIIGPLGFSVGFVLLSIVSPIMFPFSVLTLLKKLIGYKSRLEKKAEEHEKMYEKAEADAKRHSDNFMRNEGRFFETEEPINPN